MPIERRDSSSRCASAGSDSGRVCPAGEVEPLAQALVELAGDASLRAALGQAARDGSARFASTRLLADIDALYRELVPSASS